MKKGHLQKFIDKKFHGSAQEAANEMVVDFCKKHGISGSAHGYDLYEAVQKAWDNALKEEIAEAKKWDFRGIF